MTFPTTLDDFTNPTPATPTNSKTLPLSTAISQLNNAVEAIEAKIGISGSQVSGTVEKRLSDVISQSAQTVSDIASVANVANYAADLWPQGKNKLFEIVDPTVIAEWSADKSAALTVSLDNTVTYEGRPTVKIKIPAGTSGPVILCGVLGATARLPYGWDGTNLCAIFKTTNTALGSSFNAYVGDATYANSWLFGMQFKPFGDYFANNEWTTLKSALPSSNGSPSAAQLMRYKLTMSISSQAQDEYVWIAQIGISPKRKKGALSIVIDDGNATDYTFVYPLAKHYDLPVTFAWESGVMGQNGYCTTSQYAEMYEDESRLFDPVNHGAQHLDYSSVGAAAQYANFEANKAPMISLGIEDISTRICVAPFGNSGNDLVDLMISGGYLSNRLAGSYVYQLTQMSRAASGDKHMFALQPCQKMTTGVTVADITSKIDTLISTKGYSSVLGHKFSTSDGASQWTYDKARELFSKIAGYRDAGTLDVVSYTRWVAEQYGYATTRR